MSSLDEWTARPTVHKDVSRSRRFSLETAVPDAFLPAFAEAVRDYAAFTGCHEVEVGKVVPAGLSAEFRRLFAH